MSKCRGGAQYRSQHPCKTTMKGKTEKMPISILDSLKGDWMKNVSLIHEVFSLHFHRKKWFYNMHETDLHTPVRELDGGDKMRKDKMLHIVFLLGLTNSRHLYFVNNARSSGVWDSPLIIKFLFSYSYPIVCKSFQLQNIIPILAFCVYKAELYNSFVIMKHWKPYNLTKYNFWW